MSIDPTRAARLKKQFDIACNGQKLTVRTHGIFLEAVCAQPVPAACLTTLATSSTGVQNLQEAFWSDISPAFCNGPAADVIEYFSPPELAAVAGGEFLRRVFVALVDPPIFWAAFVRALKSGQLQDKALRAFATLLLRLVEALPLDAAAPYRELACEPAVITPLLESPQPPVHEAGARIKALVEAHGVVSSVASTENGPGGRHDNDKIAFREIAIVPTAEEIACTKASFLRASHELDDPRTEETRALDYLDNQFRLLREDMLYEMREELAAMAKKKKNARQSTIDSLVLHSIHYEPIPDPDDNRGPKQQLWGICLRRLVDFPQLANVAPDARKAWFGNPKNRFFIKHQSLSLVMVDDELVAIGTIHRDEGMLAREPPVVVVQLNGEANTMNALLKLKSSKNIKLVPIDVALFAYEPVLKTIQDTIFVPLQEEILFWKPDRAPSVIPGGATRIVAALRANPNCDVGALLGIGRKIELDKSQSASMLLGLTQTVSLIQGPPGTGKSFIGALLAKALHDHAGQSILVVCYTNHALDQFLEDLMNIGIPESDMIRLGSKCTDRTRPLLIRNKTSTARRGYDWNVIDGLKTKASELSDRLRAASAHFMSTSTGYQLIMDHIEFEDNEFFYAFSVPSSDDNMQIVGKKNKAVGPHYLIERWGYGQDAGVHKHAGNVCEMKDVWALPREARRVKLAAWRADAMRTQIESVYTLARQYNACVAQLDAKFAEARQEPLMHARVIGCTTTAAAMNRGALHAAAPGVLLVEEAGEILESHVLTALSPRTKQLILIGDHKQLRPKVNNYRLTVEKGEGFDLNRSMFERLVLRGYPHETLNAQHRMRPEISALVRALMYPDLVDAPQTGGRPDLHGVRDNIVFIQHEQPEGELQELPTDGAEERGRKSSKTNMYEVEMVLKIVRYVGQQGYGTDKLVLLTPYLGQLRALQSALKATNDPILNDLDNSDLARAGLMSNAAAKTTKSPIRLATIDNYQGEESDIVIVSLTRSNKNCDIGFMSAEERLNVLLSRARNALIMIGNATTFQNARKGKEAWVNLFNSLRVNGHFYEGLPVKCERHPDRIALLQTPQDFDDRAPDGGCSAPCGERLTCGHECPSKCHRILDHSKMPCEKVLHDKCPIGHQFSWRCRSGKPVSCVVCDREKKALERRVNAELDLEEKRQREAQAHAEKMAELETKYYMETEAAKDLRLADERRNALIQKEKDLQAAAERNAQKKASAAATSAGDALRRIYSYLPSFLPNSNANPSTAPPAPGGSNTSSTPTPPTQQNSAPTSSSPAATSAPAAPSRPSAARDDWDRQKSVDGAQSDAIDALMGMTGLEKVKLKVLDIKAMVDTAKRQGVQLKLRANLALLGNPGTGKTTVARHYARFLAEVGVLPGTEFVETTGSRLGSEGVDAAKKHVENVKNAGGGTIFIDEAYQLKSKDSPQGGLVLDFLLAEMENNIGQLIFIVAGYNQEMEKFFEHNPGLSSRIPHTLQFDDYTDEELLDMLESMLQSRYQGRMTAEAGIRGLFARIAVRRLGRGRGKRGFGNARALENMLSRILERQARRLKEERRPGLLPDDFLLTKVDLIGPDPADVLVESAAYKKLQSMIGLAKIKKEVANLFETAKMNYQRELLEKEPHLFTLNRVFIGSPGTGKTTVATLYGRILADLGMLSNGEVVVKNPADFVGGYIGHSEMQTKAILASTVGKVLVIDEAYMLYGGGKSSGGVDSFKTAVIDTIVAEVQAGVGDDRAVLLLGYKEQMEEMFQNVNPGLSRRFSIENAFHFADYSDSELLQALEWKLKAHDLTATDAAKKVALEVLLRLKNRPNFGNIGEVENILNRAKGRYQERQSALPASQRSPDAPFEPIDFDADFARDKQASTNLAKLFENVVGCDDIVKQLGDYQRTAQTAKSLNRNPRDLIPMNFLFKGPPGTGKTTTARKMGQVFYDMGLLSSAEVVECSASDLVGEYVGHTGPKTKNKFEQALSRVLFVDEAYRLAEGRFAKEAMDEIVAILTDERYRSKLLVILAGYDHEMDGLMSVNPGLASRFTATVIFNNLSIDQSLTILDRELRQNHIIADALIDKQSPSRTEINDILTSLSALPSWGNARDVQTLAKEMVGLVYTNPSSGAQGVGATNMLSISDKDFVECMKSMLLKRRRHTPARVQRGSDDGLPEASETGSAPPPPQGAAAGKSKPSAPPPPPPSKNAGSAKPKPSKPERKQQRPPASPQQPVNRAPSNTPPVSPQTTNRRQSKRDRVNMQASPPTPVSPSQRQSPMPTPPSSPVQQRRPPRQPAVQQQGAPSAPRSIRDAGVSDAVWAQLEADKRAEEDRQQRERAAEVDRVRRERALRKMLEEQRRAEQQRREEEARLARAQLAREARAAAEAEIRRRREEAKAREAERARMQAALDAERRAAEMRRQEEQRAQTKLRQMGVCVAGFRWIKSASGYRCAGGSHFVHDSQLQ